MVSIKLLKGNIDTAMNASVTILRRGGIVAYPTETFYGLGVMFDKPDSLKRLYRLKRRPAEKAMPVIIGDEGVLPLLASGKWLKEVPAAAKSLMGRFWPGPLTLLIPARESLSEYLTAKTGMIAVRVPGESFALSLARKAGFPITATSANVSGMPPAGDAGTVMRYFGKEIDLIVDGGRTPGGLPSTIVDASDERIVIVREGVISSTEIWKHLTSAEEEINDSLDKGGKK